MKRLLIIMGLTVAVLTGCQKQDLVTDIPPSEPAKDYVLAHLALSLPAATETPAATRMAEGVVQSSGNSFRGIQKLSMIPFTKPGKVVSTDLPAYYEVGNLKQDFEAAKTLQYRIYEKFYLRLGVASFLTYGQATSPTGQKAAYGSLLASIDGTTYNGIPDDVAVTPANLSFELEPIYGSEEAPSEATAIADYLTDIAQARVKNSDEEEYTWATYDGDASLKAYYANFINESSGNYGIIAGSSANVKAFVNNLSENLQTITEGVAGDLATEIQRRIESYPDNCDDYPGKYDLPDGAAVLRWGKKTDDTYGFMPQLRTTTLSNISNVSCYAYPAELYYYGNSLIQTSNNEVPLTAYEGKTTWGDVLTLYPNGTEVSSNTRAVAIVDPMQYAVAHLKATVKAAGSTLLDHDGHAVEVAATAFPITGMIVSGQYPQRFDFTAMDDEETDARERFAYDKHLKPSDDSADLYLTPAGTTPFHTLLLQSRDEKDVTIILELENNSGKDFQGENGIVFKGTKFYLMGKAVLSSKKTVGDGVDEDAKKRVFTQDHTTEISMKVNTLAHAYNVMPNIQTGRLEVSVEVNLDWIQATPVKIEFDE